MRIVDWVPSLGRVWTLFLVVFWPLRCSCSLCYLFHCCRALRTSLEAFIQFLLFIYLGVTVGPYFFFSYFAKTFRFEHLTMKRPRTAPARRYFWNVLSTDFIAFLQIFWKCTTTGLGDLPTRKCCSFVSSLDSWIISTELSNIIFKVPEIFLCHLRRDFLFSERHILSCYTLFVSPSHQNINIEWNCYSHFLID